VVHPVVFMDQAFGWRNYGSGCTAWIGEAIRCDGRTAEEVYESIPSTTHQHDMSLWGGKGGG